MLRLILTACLAALALTAATAQADMVVAGTGEPAFTNSANNTQWFEWSNSGPYRVEFSRSVNGGPGKVDGPYSIGPAGTMWANWTGVAGVTTPLQEGSTYTTCGLGRWQDASGMWFPDFTSSCSTPGGKRSSTTIDRTKPAITLAAPELTRELQVPVTIGYQDNLAYPFGVAFVAVDGGQYAELPGCAPADPTAKTTTFACTVTLPQTDGAHSVCAIVPDAAVPDNPNSPDQRGSATQANRSDPKCRELVLDRVAPQAVVTAPADLLAGHAGLFVAQVADAGSGLTDVTWSWGDGTTSTGVDASHVYAAPGAYRLRFTATDAAGNRVEVVKDLTVRAAPPAPGGGGERDDTTAPLRPAPVPTIVPGGGETPALAIRAKRSGKRLRVTVSGANGSARVVLKRGKRVVVSKRLTIKRGRLTLPLPHNVMAGRHVVEVTAGGRMASATVTLSGSRSAKASGSMEIDARGLERKLP